MKTKRFGSTCNVNALAFFESLPLGERHTGSLTYDDLFPLATCDFYMEFRTVRSAAAFSEEMARLAELTAERGLHPILHLDIHGDPTKGLQIAPSNEFIPWPRFLQLAREINRASVNNLTITMAVCHGFHAAAHLGMLDVSPFFALVAPVHKVSAGALEDSLRSFYHELFRSRNLQSAILVLPPGYTFLNCEQALLTAYLHWSKEVANGKRDRPRLSAVVASLARYRHNPDPGPPPCPRPTPDHFELCRKRFLMAEHPSNVGRFTVSFADIRDLLGSGETVAVRRQER